MGPRQQRSDRDHERQHNEDVETYRSDGDLPPYSRELADLHDDRSDRRND